MELSLSNLRTNVGYTQQELADMMGLSRSKIASLEVKKSVEASVIDRYLRVLEYDFKKTEPLTKHEVLEYKKNMTSVGDYIVSIENIVFDLKPNALIMFYSQYKDYIKYLRQKAGYTQSELADKIGIGRSSIALYESGRRRANANVFQKIVDAMGYDYSDYTNINFKGEHIMVWDAPSSIKERKEMLLDEHEQLLIDKYRQLTSRQQHKLLQDIEIILQKKRKFKKIVFMDVQK